MPLDAIKWQGHIIQPFDEKVTHLNAGQSMAKIENVPGQVDYLVHELETKYKDAVTVNDWKLLTIFIGLDKVMYVDGRCK